MIENYQAFILSQSKYKTSSIIASFLTNKSLIQAICHKAKKENKVFGSDLSSISKINICVYKKEEGHLSILKESTIEKNYKSLEKSMYLSLSIFYIKEILLYYAKDFDNRYFILMEKLLDSLEKLENIYGDNDNKIKEYITIILRAFEIKTIHISGLSPQLEYCIICDKQVLGNYYYSINENSIICSNCSNKIRDTIELKDDDIKFMKFIKYNSFMDILKDENVNKYIKSAKYNVRDILKKSLINHIHKDIKSLKVLEEILYI